LQWSSGGWAPRIDSWGVCEAGRGVNRTGVAPAARNCGELRVYLCGGAERVRRRWGLGGNGLGWVSRGCGVV
jgi:hypothetical protein